MLHKLADAALACGRGAEVERHLEAVDGLHPGWQVHVRLSLSRLVAARGDRARARELLGPYAGWQIENARLAAARQRVAGE